MGSTSSSPSLLERLTARTDQVVTDMKLRAKERKLQAGPRERDEERARRIVRLRGER